MKEHLRRPISSVNRGMLKKRGKNPMEIKKRISTNKLVMVILFAALLTIVPLSVYGNSAESATTTTSYVDESGVAYAGATATVLVGNEGTLMTGLYYADSSYLPGITADIIGDVTIIIGAGQTLTSNAPLFNVSLGNTLRLYTETGGTVGVASVNNSAGAIIIKGGTLINTAKVTSNWNVVSVLENGGVVKNYGTIENTANKGAGVSVNTTSVVKITNYQNSVIKGMGSGVYVMAADANSIIANYGEMRGTITSESYGVRSSVDITIQNFKDALIRGGSHGISLSVGGTIDNDGTIHASESSLWAYSVVGSGYIKITNRENGYIYGLVYSIRLIGGGEVNNYGTIIGTGSWGYGVYIDKPSTVNNFEGGYIYGLGNGIYICDYMGAGMSIINNSGKIEGAAGIFCDTNTSAKITNFETGVIHATSYNGVWFPAGGEIYNFGSIIGTTRAIGASGSVQVILMNAGTLDGFVRLADAVNKVTFAVGSKIIGNFTIGSNPESTLAFTGAGSLDASVTYAVITGNAELGSAAITFDDAALPAWAISKTIILIDGESVSNTDQMFHDWVIHIRGANQLVAEHIEESIVPPSEKHYYITAISDKNSTISPSGVTEMLKGESKTFVFSATPGNAIVEVRVDGKLLSQEEIILGYYTFKNVNMNHTIEVWSTGALVLEIVVVEGVGHVDYSLNGKTFQTYKGVVLLPDHAFITLVAYGDDGHVFTEWNTATKIYTTQKLKFDDVTYSIYLEVHFTKEVAASGPISESESWYIAGFVVLLAGLLLFFFVFYYRRKYDVVKVEGAAVIIGDERATRKRAYTFTVEGGQVGTVRYSIGDKEDREWKTLSPNEKGLYVIPKCEVVGKITIQCS